MGKQVDLLASQPTETALWQVTQQCSRLRRAIVSWLPLPLLAALVERGLSAKQDPQLITLGELGRKDG